MSLENDLLIQIYNYKTISMVVLDLLIVHHKIIMFFKAHFGLLSAARWWQTYRQRDRL